jgi:hypothetical protein
MTPRASARVSLLLALVACTERAGVAEPVKAEPAVGVKAPPVSVPLSAGDAPAAGSGLPTGIPTAEGRIDQLLAVDGERAVVRFLVPGPEHAKLWWLALMRRDGSVDWVQPLSGMLAQSEDMALVQAGDAVSIATSDISGDDPVVSLRGFALADGAPRFTTVLGSGFITNTRTDGQLRFDTRVQYNFASGGETEGELTATSPQGVVWRSRVGAPIPVGHDPTIVGDAIAVRTEQRRSRATTWQVFERSSGKARGELVAEPQSCSDGQRWFVRGAEGLLAVDPATVTTRLVLAPPTLPGADGTWVIEDCTLVDDVPVVLAARGHRKALVALDPRTLAIQAHVEIGAAAVGMNGFDPLPARAHGVLALRSLAGESDELLVVDPGAGKVVGRWRSKAEFGSLAGALPWSGGVLLATETTIAVIRRDTGALEGQAVIKDAMVDEGQIAGDLLWLRPEPPMLLGKRAPLFVELAKRAPEEVRDAVLTDVESAEAAAARGNKRAPCPDPTAVVRGDGIAVDPTPAPVAASRLPAWDLEILRETARMLACAPASAATRLLAWYVMEDDRPLRNDNALLLVEDAAAAPPRFSLVAVYRHATNHEWNTVGSFHDRREPVRTFDHRPTRKEVDAFIEQSGWTFVDTWGRVIAGNVIDDEWRAATGKAPWKAFPAAVERPD